MPTTSPSRPKTPASTSTSRLTTPTAAMLVRLGQGPAPPEKPKKMHSCDTAEGLSKPTAVSMAQLFAVLPSPAKPPMKMGAWQRQ